MLCVQSFESTTILPTPLVRRTAVAFWLTNKLFFRVNKPLAAPVVPAMSNPKFPPSSVEKLISLFWLTPVSTLKVVEAVVPIAPFWIIQYVKRLLLAPPESATVCDAATLEGLLIANNLVVPVDNGLPSIVTLSAALNVSKVPPVKVADTVFNVVGGYKQWLLEK